MNCNACGSPTVDQVLSLPDYPLNSVYVNAAEARRTDRYQPRDFSLHTCGKCGLFQADSAVELTELYTDDYAYNTQNAGVQGRIGFFLSQLKPLEGMKFNRVIDVGCFDLSLLKAVKQRISANHFIGIDPSTPLESLDNEEGIICLKDYVDNVDLPYFNANIPDLVVSDQTFEHIPTISSTLSNIVRKTSRNSVFAVCVPSLEVLIEKLTFHNLIHEHVNYFSISALNNLCELSGLALKSYTLNYVSTCGFLLGIFEKSDVSSSGLTVHAKKIDKEQFLRGYDMFGSLLSRTTSMVTQLQNERIYGLGASDITANLAYFMKSDLSFLTSIIDDTPYKQGKFIPSLKPEIISQDAAEDLSDSNCLITAPQAGRYIYARANDFKFKRIINPIGLIA